MILTILLILVVVATVIGAIRNTIKADELDEREEELDKYSVHLDERANRLAADESALRALSLSFRRELDAFHKQGLFMASYTETDSDTMRCSDDNALVAHAKKHLAKVITQDIIKRFEMKESRTEDGKRKFTYRFKIAEQ